MKKALITIIIMVLFITVIFGIIYVFKNETKEMQSQENIGEFIAEKYLIDISQQYINNESNSSDTLTPIESRPSDFDYNDNEIYSYFDESDAKGYVDCVLEIPAINLRQSVFSGDVEQITHDLSRWLAVTARSDYILGASQYCIYMHNPRDKSIQISLAQDNLNVGDYMVVTQKDKVYLYTVTGVFSEWRNKCTQKYVNSNDVSCEKLYIFTCARGEWQGKNLVIEGDVYESYSLNDWSLNKDQYIEQYKKEVGLIIEDVLEPNKQTPLNITLTVKNEKLFTSVINDNFTSISCSIGIFNEEGYLIDNLSNPIEYTGGEVEIPILPSGNYYIGIYECEDGYYSNTSYHVSINRETNTYKFTSSDEENNNEQQFLFIIKLIAIFFMCLSILLGITVVIKNIKKT